MKFIFKNLFLATIKILAFLSNFLIFFRRKKIRKILLIPEFENFGGTKTYFKQLLNFYAKCGFEISVLINIRQARDLQDSVLHSNPYINFIIQKEEESSIQEGTFHELSRLLKEVFCAWKLIQRFRPDMIVVSASKPGELIGACILPVRFLYILHTYPTSQINFSRIALLKNSLGKTKKILTVSYFSKKNILDFWKLHNKNDFIDVVYNSVFNEHLQTQTNGLELDKNRKIIILTLGHVENYKQPELWIEVAQKITKENQGKNIEFIWVGHGTLLDKCREKVQLLENQNIHFVGFYEDICQFYKAASIYFQPSLIESHGISVLEAMSYKIPCVVSNNGGLPESVINDVTGFIVDIKNIEETAEKLNLLINNESFRRKMGDLAYIRYLEKFSHRLWINNMLKLHETML